jgi:hypothetical protein
MACLCGLIFWGKVKGSYWKLFPVYLLFIVFSELLGQYTKVYKLLAINKYYFLYLEIPIEFLFFFYIFYQAFKNKKYSWLPVACSGLYILCWIIDMFFIGSHRLWFSSFSVTIGNFLLLILILTYFIQLVTSNAILNFKGDMLFWVSTGLLLFYLGTFPFYGLGNVLYHNYRDVYNAYKFITTILDSSMYIMFAFSFIWGRPKNI